MRTIQRSFILILALTLGAHFSWGQQSRALRKGNRDYEAFNYFSAIERYERAKDLDLEAARRLAQSYVRTGELEKAASKYDSICQQPDRTAADHWEYAQVLKRLGQYDRANAQKDKFAAMTPNDLRAQAYKGAGDYMSKIKSKADLFTISHLEINSPQEDFAAMLYGDAAVVFASSREGVKPVRRRWNGNRLPFLDLYLAQRGDDGALTAPERFSTGGFNKKYHEGPAAFALKDSLVAYTRNNYEGKSTKGVRNLKLWVATKQKNGFTKAEEVPFNSAEYSVGHASFTPDGSLMFFASDMPGGKGGVDIWSVTRSAEGAWGSPINVSDINTEGDEMFPYYHPQGLLFFSSNGQVGLGGLDVFISQYKNGKASKIENLGSALNSKDDDFAFVLDAPMKGGYFSSNREGGNGDDDIYSFILRKPFNFGKKIKGTSLDKSGNIVANAQIELKDPSGKVIGTAVSDAQGKYSFDVEESGVYSLSGSKEKFFPGASKADVKEAPETVADVVLEADPGLSLYAVVTDKADGKPLEGVKLTLLNNLTGKEEVITTPVTGDYLKALADNKLNDRISYNLKLEKEGYLTKTVTYNQQLTRPGRYDVASALDLSMDKLAVGMDLAKIIDIKPIFFDLGKHAIRPDAALELEKIVKVMNEYPTMEVELGSHTDCRSSIAFNEALSDRRAKASAAYIQAKITNPQRIYGKGYGESQLVNGCACEGAVKSTCSEEEHQKNRRTEFKIIKM
jgi:outer membrane protein OmpA-like peptidoglycan-associated protein/tetratricopeptide (TPR) repeat protein